MKEALNALLKSLTDKGGEEEISKCAKYPSGAKKT